MCLHTVLHFAVRNHTQYLFFQTFGDGIYLKLCTGVRLHMFFQLTLPSFDLRRKYGWTSSFYLICGEYFSRVTCHRLLHKNTKLCLRKVTTWFFFFSTASYDTLQKIHFKSWTTSFRQQIPTYISVIFIISFFQFDYQQRITPPLPVPESLRPLRNSGLDTLPMYPQTKH